VERSGQNSMSQTSMSAGNTTISSGDSVFFAADGSRTKLHSELTTVDGKGTATTKGTVRTPRPNSKKFDYETIDIEEDVELDEDSFEFFIAHNKRELELSIDIGGKKWSIAELKQEVLAGLKEAFDDIRKFADLLKAAPQVGWKFSLDIGILAGKLLLSWGPDPGEKRDDDRYYPVDFAVTFKIKMKIIEIKATVSLGVSAKVGGTGFECLVGLEFFLSVLAEIDVKLGRDKPEVKVPVKVTAWVRAFAVAQLTFFNYEVAGATIEAKALIFMNDGNLKVSLESGIKLTGTVQASGIVVCGHVKGPGMVPVPLDPPLQVTHPAILYAFK
jgi:hypothetical protein